MKKNPLLLIAKAMREEGLSQVALARKLGINQGNLSRILRGKQAPREDTKIAFRRVLGLPLDVWPLQGVSLRAVERVERTQGKAA
jgi:transcriptional regulator with XRE-family HTH domain